MKRIHKLDPSVVARIAAGEVIHRPASAIKELLENSIDAGATNISVSCREGGLKLIQIQDDGCGIHKDDFPMLCERFTTSKLNDADGVYDLETYGFRGEALASISHVARVSVISRTRDEICAYKGNFANGELLPPSGKSEPGFVPCAGVVGTQITVEDLFASLPARRQSLRPSEEYNRILEMITHYAVHCASKGVSLVCRKYGKSSADVQTSMCKSSIDAIRGLYGTSVAQNLIEVDFKADVTPEGKLDRPERIELHTKGWTSVANYSASKLVFILIINGRLVRWKSLQQSIVSVYSELLPRKKFPFIYIDITFPKRSVDVNIHPTKAEVQLEHQDLVINRVTSELQTLLEQSDSSRTFTTQQIQPTLLESNGTSASSGTSGSQTLQKKSSVNPTKQIRTQADAQTLDQFVRQRDQTTGESITNNTSTSNTLSARVCDVAAGNVMPIFLSSIRDLLRRVAENCDPYLLEVFRNSVLVGEVDHRSILIQSGTSLYYIDLEKALEELCYQQVLRFFNNFCPIRLSSPAPVNELLIMAMSHPNICLDAPNSQAERQTIADEAAQYLLTKAEMIEEYFGIRIIAGAEGNLVELTHIPLLVHGLSPQVLGLPRFLAMLVWQVNWQTEEDCFEDIARTLARLYSLREPEGEPKVVPQTHSNVENVLFPALKMGLSPSTALQTRGAVVKLADTQQLYRIFERC